jgi:transcriptional regulator with XRE-family HTH domain
MSEKQKTDQPTPEETLPTDKKRIAERLRKARGDAGLTQAQLASQSDVGRSAIVHYENAKAIPGGMELIKLANTLGKTPNYILSGSEQFHESTEPEHAFATGDIEQLIPRITFCLLALDREVSEKFSELLMSLVKQKFSKADYESFVVGVNALDSTMSDIFPDLGNFMQNLGKDGRFNQLEQDLESITQEKKD